MDGIDHSVLPRAASSMPRLAGEVDGWMPPTEHCPVAVGTRLMGDRWSLLIVRELLVGVDRFNALQRALPGLSKSLLASRLRYLERIGVAERSVSDDHPNRTRYRLTSSGVALRPVLEALGTWTLDWQLPPRADAELNVAALMWQMFQAVDRDAVPSTDFTLAYRFLAGPTPSAWLHVGSTNSGACVGPSERPADLTVIVDPAILNELWWGRRACTDAIRAGDVGFEGPTAFAAAYPSWFGPRDRGA